MVSLNPDLLPLDLGDVSLTSGLLYRLSESGDNMAVSRQIVPILNRFAARDWGDCYASDRKSNDDDLKSGYPCQILGVYHVFDVKNIRTKIFVVHHPAYEGNKAQTTVMLPEDY